MRNWRRGVWALALAVIAAPHRSQAQLVVVTPADEPRAIAHAELAYAHGKGEPVTWLSLRLKRGPVAVVAALPKDASADAGLDAWLAALESTASPNILLPTSATDCSKTGSFVHVSWPREAGAPGNELSLQDRADVVTALDELGLPEPSELPEADHYALWSWLGGGPEQTTRTLRIVGGRAPLPLLPSWPFPLLVSSVSPGPQALPGELGNDALRVQFVAGEPTSDYTERLQSFLDVHREPVLETRVRGPLFDWSIFADTVSVPSLVESYALGAVHEQPSIDVARCTEQLRALRDADAPSPGACGDARDADLALAAAGPEQPTLQRFAVSAAAGIDPAAFYAGGEPSPPVLRASSLDDSACTSIDLPPTPIVVNPPPRGGGSTTGSAATVTGAGTVVVEQTVVVDDTSSSVDVGCSSSPGDPYYDDRDSSSCSSDTSSDADTSDSSCSSDSSSSSRDSGCGSDSSSSSSDDTSCDGGSEDSSYDGDTCTGSAAPGADRSRKVQAGLSVRYRAARPRRVKTSLWSLAFVAVVLPIRRLKRR
ncbi:MAG TPA: hypothetical protein VEQ59_24430 [Polyangiaceae bacterium]|nr:hypothetical protein [Polyangiaceae bacterium]